MSDSIEVVVDVPTPEPEPVAEPEAAPEVVVVVEDSPEGEAAPVDAVIDHEGRLAVLEMGQATIISMLETMAARTDTAAAIAAEAQDAASTAIDIAVEANDDGQASPEQDESPDYEHPFFKTRRRKK